MNQDKYAVVVDPTSSGGLLAGELKRRGIESIAVHSQPLRPDIPVAKAYFPQDYRHEITLEGDYGELVERIAAFDPVGIFVGNEPGVRLADRLVADFGFPGNDPNLTGARTNKYEMQEALRRAGLRAIEQVKSDDPAVIMRWLAERDRLPVFVKPLSSGGTDGVRLCHSADQVRRCFDDILSRNNTFGYPNREVLVQEYIRGSEWVVDATSCDGRHFVLDVCKYRKFFLDNGSPVYREMRFHEPHRDVYRDLIEYTEKALDALGIRYGSSHSEVMMTDDGPVLIETGARLSGAYIPRNIQLIARCSQLDMTVDSILFPETFFERMKRGQRFERCGTMLFLVADRGGVVRSFPGRRAIEDLPTFVNSTWRVTEGEYLKATVDLITSPGMIFLAADDWAQIDRDIARIERMEREALLFEYETEAPVPA